MYRSFIILALILLFNKMMFAQSLGYDSWHVYVDSLYQNQKINFNSSFIDHFPDNLFDIDDIGRIHYVDKGSLYPYQFSIQVFYNQEKFDSIVSQHRKESKACYNGQENCLVVHKFVNHKNFGSKSHVSKKEMLNLELAAENGMLPIPNLFRYNEQKETVDRAFFPQGYIILVLEATEGRFLSDKFLSDGKIMPDKWKHGKAKGIALNRRDYSIIYWFVVW